MAWKNRLINEYTKLDEKRRGQLNREYNELLTAFHHSILCCRCKGDDTMKNMVYIAQYEGWFCEECYNDIQETTDPKRWFNESIMVDENAEKPCYILKWCPYGGLVEAFRIRREISRYTCQVFGHDCPVFYISEKVIEKSLNRPKFNEELRNEAKRIRFKHLKKYFRPEFEKPCILLKYCPYGVISLVSKKRNVYNEFTCKLFGFDCPVFYKAEYASEKLEKEIKADISKDLKDFLI
ncbi:MAG: hypothetical protein CEE43_14470 [Promethearchaeota archaeon Loki_b32]|nr:MAG: hypothetical protein CEE43_14470 [Candidatus Lokiarchaeota archaeon Loki_b32]